ncbi:MAG: calcium/sodium antiporter [Rhizobiaceae bacterium]|jgi:cation:H+ antiporter|nr:calcium/sodium antiporter [Rhizobiaceae bacterium]
MVIDLLLIAAGLVLLFYGGEALIKGAVSLAKKLGLPTLIISLTVVGFGTSMPELLVSLRAAFAGSPDIALGNVIGSNTANILLILGLCMAVAPIATYDPGARMNMLKAMGVALVVWAMVQGDAITRLYGAILFAGLITYIVYSYMVGRKQGAAAEDEDETLRAAPMSGGLTAGWLALGFALLFAGAEMLVRGAVSIARDFGISEAVIGLTIVAVGTSLPELATSLVAAMRRQGDVALGNIIGSNIFNILGILGIAAMVKPIGVGANFPALDVPVMVAVSLALLALLWLRLPLGRVAGLAFLAAYVAYTVALASGVTALPGLGA